LCKHLSIAIPLDELNRDVEVEQTRERFPRHRTQNNIASNDDMGYSFLANLMEDSLECGKIAMEVIEDGDTHNRSNLTRLATGITSSPGWRP